MLAWTHACRHRGITQHQSSSHTDVCAKTSSEILLELDTADLRFSAALSLHALFLLWIKVSGRLMEVLIYSSATTISALVVVLVIMCIHKQGRV